MTSLTFTRITMTMAIATSVFITGTAFAQTPPTDPATAGTNAVQIRTPPAKVRGARDKNASENSIGAANAQIDAAGGTPLKKRNKKVKISTTKPVIAPTAPTAGDSGSTTVKP